VPTGSSTSVPKAATAAAKSSPPAEDIAREKRSYTGAFLKPVLARKGAEQRKKKRVEAGVIFSSIARSFDENVDLSI
jgi:hypothetical protein